MNTTMRSFLISALFFGGLYVIYYFARRDKGIDKTRREKIDASIAKLNQYFRVPFADFEIPQKVSACIGKDSIHIDGIRMLLDSLAKHCGMERAFVSVRLYNEAKGLPPGQFIYDGKNGVIELRIPDGCPAETIFAIVIHEFCHYCLFKNQIKYEATLDNEILTDTAAIYFGFGYNMLNGYRYISSVNKGRLHSLKIGYLDLNEIRHAIEICEKKRKTG